MGIFSSLGGAAIGGIMGAIGSHESAKKMRQYRDALQRNIAQNNADAAKIASDARGYQQAAEGSMARRASEQNAQNRALQAMGMSSASVAAQAQAQSDSMADLASKGSQQTLATAVNAQNNANTMNNAIRGQLANGYAQEASQVQKMYSDIGSSLGGIISSNNIFDKKK